MIYTKFQNKMSLRQRGSRERSVLNIREHPQIPKLTTGSLIFGIWSYVFLVFLISFGVLLATTPAEESQIKRAFERAMEEARKEIPAIKDMDRKSKEIVHTHLKEQAQKTAQGGHQKCDGGCSKMKIEGLKREEGATPSGIIIFVSFSMPDPTLRSLFKETQALGGRLVMRGLSGNSFQETQRRLGELEIDVAIDPTLFEKYSVSDVPAFVHQEAGTEKFDSLKGNVSLRFALEAMLKEGDVKDPVLSKKLEEAI